MSNHEKLLSIMKGAITEVGIKEIAASGDFAIDESPVSIYPGSVYGFACILTEDEKKLLFDEATQKGLSKIAEQSMFEPISENFYPLYWGKDKQLGARPYQHIGDPTGTGAIRLSSYVSLKGKKISCAVIVVNNYAKAESVLQRKYPNLLKTTTAKQSEI